jgi:hypothetical protein
MKKLVFLSAIFCVSTTNAFFDIQPSDPQFAIFEHLKEVGVMTGGNDGNLYPEKLVTRAEALAIAMRIGHIVIPTSTEKTHFEDVNLNAWFAPVIERAAELELVNLKTKSFRPNALVSKVEFLTFLFRSTNVSFYEFRNKTKNVALDVPEDAWFATVFAYAKKYGIAHLPSDQFYRPTEVLTRRRAAIMAFRQAKIFNGDAATKNLVELNAQISQFIELLRAGKTEAAEFHLQKITALTHSLAQLRNDKNAIAARAISKSIEHFSESFRAFRVNKKLAAIENLHIATKFAKRAAEKSESISPFAKELNAMINETLLGISGKNFLKLSQK